MLEVDLEKMRTYVGKNHEYALKESGNSVILAFSPRAPEIKVHLGDFPKIELTGKIIADKVRFTGMVIEDRKGRRKFDIKEAEASFLGWLETIESRY
jgi:hypothetical protein